MSRTAATARTAASARTAATSRSTGSTRPIGVHIESWIPLNITTCSSINTGSFSPTCSRAYIDPQDYDGNPSFTFVAIAQNTDGADRNIALLDSANNVLATVLVPNGTTTLVRFPMAFTLNATADTYHIRLDQTTSSNTLVAKPCRIEVKQTFATKTILHFTLASKNTNFNTDATAIIDQSSSTSFTQANADRFSIWKRVSSAFSTILSTNGYRFSAVLSNANAGATTTAALFNRTSNNEVVASQVANTGTTLTLVSADFTSDTEFTDNTEFEVRFKTSSNTGRIHKAILSIKLQAVANAVFKGESHGWHSMPGDSTFTINSTHSQGTIKVDSSAFSNPTFANEEVGRESVAGSSGTTIIGMQDIGTRDDVGAVGVGNQVSGTTVDFTGISTKTRTRTSTFSIVDGDRYYGLTKPIATGATAVHTLGTLVCSWTSAGR